MDTKLTKWTKPKLQFGVQLCTLEFDIGLLWHHYSLALWKVWYWITWEGKCISYTSVQLCNEAFTFSQELGEYSSSQKWLWRSNFGTLFTQSSLSTQHWATQSGTWLKTIWAPKTENAVFQQNQNLKKSQKIGWQKQFKMLQQRALRADKRSR